MGVPQLHICATCDVAVVERIKHHQRAIVAGIDALHQPLMAKPAHLLEAWQLQSSFGPFIEGQFGWVYFNPIHIIGGVVADYGAFGWVNFTGLVECLSQGWPLYTPQDCVCGLAVSGLFATSLL